MEQNAVNIQKSEKKFGRFYKILCVVLVLLLLIGMLGITVYNGNQKVENGLSAYELAVKYGYDGTVQDWLTSLSGKSAYEIAVDNVDLPVPFIPYLILSFSSSKEITPLEILLQFSIAILISDNFSAPPIYLSLKNFVVQSCNIYLFQFVLNFINTHPIENR